MTRKEWGEKLQNLQKLKDRVDQERKIIDMEVKAVEKQIAAHRATYSKLPK